jgi:Domain of unknown function (DUF5666)
MSDASRLRTPKTGFKSVLQFSVIAIAAAIAAACGGGGVGSEGTGITASYSSGTVNGFGSIVVNGVHYDLSASTEVRGDDDVSGPSGDSNRGVKIGMEVEIESGAVNCATTTGETVCRANATSVSWGTEFKGPIVGNPASGSFTILGQTVLINDATIFVGKGAIDTKAELAAGQIVEVHGRYNRATNELTATLIEVKAADLASFDGEFRFAGELTAFTAFTPASGATPAALGSATVAGVTLEINAGTEVRGATLGKRVRVRIDPSVTPTTSATWVADRIRSAGRDLRDHVGREGEIKGVTSGFVLNPAGTVATFLVDGMPVSVTRADVGDAVWTLILGLGSTPATVEVEGRVGADGVLIVRKVELEDEDQFEIELTGTLTFSGNTLTIGDKTFDFADGGVEVRLNGNSVTVNAADLLSRFANGQRVEVKGLLQPDGVTVKLVRIKRED